MTELDQAGHIAAAAKLIEAADGEFISQVPDYQRATACASLAQAHISIAGYQTNRIALGQLEVIADGMTAQIPL